MMDELMYEERHPEAAMVTRVIPSYPDDGLYTYLRALALDIEFEGDRAERYAKAGDYGKAYETELKQNTAIARQETAKRILSILGIPYPKEYL